MAGVELVFFSEEAAGLEELSLLAAGFALSLEDELFFVASARESVR